MEREKAHQSEETSHIEEVEEVVFQTTECTVEDTFEGAEYYNFDTDVDSYENDEHLIYYDCLADSATTSYVSNCCDTFTSFEPTENTLVGGIGGIKTHAKGRGTVTLESTYEGRKYTLTLKDVLYIPGNKNNLISLGRWEAAGGAFEAHKGKLTLTAESGKRVATGTRMQNNLYKIKFKLKVPTQRQMVQSDHVFTAHEVPSWEAWHQRFGHIGYTGLQKLYDQNLVNGFDVDTRTPKPDCIVCTEGKLAIKPFDKQASRAKEVGQLTHIDLWGKYDITSLHGHQYYILFVNDFSRYTTVEFLKAKSQASAHVKAYLTYLKARGRESHVIRVDRGKEFINEDLKS